VIIRPYAPEDQPQIEAIQEESQSSLAAVTPDGYFEDLSNIPLAFSEGAFLVAVSKDEIAGYGGLLPSGEIVRMRVASIHRRRGIATRLLRALVDSARKLGKDRIYLHTLEEQTSAQLLYTSFGFSESARGVLLENSVVAYEFEL